MDDGLLQIVDDLDETANRGPHGNQGLGIERSVRIRRIGSLNRNPLESHESNYHCRQTTRHFETFRFGLLAGPLDSGPESNRAPATLRASPRRYQCSCSPRELAPGAS